MLSQPINQDLDIYRDRDFRKTYELRDGDDNLLNTYGWEFKAQIRPVAGSDVLIAELDLSHSYTYATIVISIDDVDTLNMNVENPIKLGSSTSSTNMVWDLVATNNAGYRYSLLYGKVTFHETITREDD
jgi:hypothetical protein